MFNLSCFQKDCAAIRQQSPLILNITNYVAMNFTANAQLAAGASPLMSFCPQEMEELVTLAKALSINIGCLDSQLIEASKIAAAKAAQTGHPWVLDPVGVGASSLRTSVAVELIEKFHPSVIRGNASEILFLACEICGSETTHTPSRGVDSAQESSGAVAAAKILSQKVGAVVSVSGEVDYITDGIQLETITAGSPLMRQVTAMGCTATAITAAFLAVNRNSFQAAVNAMAMMGQAGSKAAVGSTGTGTFAVRFIDALSNS